MNCVIRVLGKVVILRFHTNQGKVVCTYINLMSLTSVDYLYTVGYGLKHKLVWLLSHQNDNYFQPNEVYHMMACIARRVASKQVSTMRDKAANQANELCTLGKCAAALVPLQKAIYLRDCSSLALKAWLLIHGREGVVKDYNEAFELAKEGVRLDCHHCQGVAAYCYLYGLGCERNYKRSMELAHKSSGRDSKYGQYVIGLYVDICDEDLKVDYNQSVASLHLAVAQNLCDAQNFLGRMYGDGRGVAQNRTKALEMYQLAAAQGLPVAFINIAFYYEYGICVPKNMVTANSLIRRAQTAGYPPPSINSFVDFLQKIES
jgi:TPR repeat protein